MIAMSSDLDITTFRISEIFWFCWDKSLLDAAEGFLLTDVLLRADIVILTIKMKDNSQKEPLSDEDAVKTLFYYACLNAVGKPCTIKTRDNKTVKGHLYTLAEKGAVLKNPSNQVRTENLVSLTFSATPIKHRKFKTDQEIVKTEQKPEKELQAWQEPEEADFQELEANTNLNWDQFETNKQKFGVVSTWDENLYTTPVPSESTLTKEQISKAEKLELELSKSETHKEESEEANFGAVLGSGRFLEKPQKQRQRASLPGKRKWRKKQVHSDITQQYVEVSRNSLEKRCEVDSLVNHYLSSGLDNTLSFQTWDN